MGQGWRGLAAPDRFLLSSRELQIPGLPFRKRSEPGGVRRGSPVRFALSHTLPGGLLLYHKRSLFRKTLKAFSFWKPEVCENKDREQQEPFMAAVCEQPPGRPLNAFFSLVNTGHTVPTSDSWGKMFHTLKTQIFIFFPQYICSTSTPPPLT